MFVELEVDFTLPPLPLPLDWSSKIAVSGTSSMMSPPSAAGTKTRQAAAIANRPAHRENRFTSPSLVGASDPPGALPGRRYIASPCSEFKDNFYTEISV